ncbi:ABC transporter permease [Leptolyngbya ohadii]|uniref:ABC transporter permease n=1 Tax=Leptolyngbya ohadii TaxID=1962290 RepID=UPI000B59D586|nr:ABC transporter permease [Leptolyngbya ohadii]
MRSIDRKLLRDLWHMRGQGVAIALVVACGIAIFIAMLSAYQSLAASQIDYYQQYRFAQVFAQLKRAPETLVEQIQSIPGVAQVQPRVVVDVTLDVPGQQEPAIGRLVSVPEQQTPMLNDVFIRQGRYLEPERAEEVLVSEAFATANHLKLNDRVGAIINGRWQQLNIVGIALSPEYVYEIQGGDVVPDNQRFGVFWMGRKALGTAFDMDGAFNDLTLTLTPQTNPKDVIFRLDQLLQPYGGFGAYDRADQISNKFVTDEIIQLKYHALIIPGIFLGIAAFLLHILLSRLIGTQRDQIAILKAFGYSNGDVGLHFLKLVLVIVFLGSVIGVAAGLWMGSGMLHIYTNYYHFPTLTYQVSPALILGTIAISGSAAIVGAFSAVQNAVSLPPAEAMRPEPPAHFRRTLMERLGLQVFLSPVGRIILRNLERKPIQAILSIVGISLAIAMLIVGRYSQDSIAYLIDVQFRLMQREDVTLIFNQPRSAGVRYDVAHLPGVLYAEPFRSVAVRLRHEQYSRQLGILGLESEGQLHRLIDRNLQVVDLPPEGVLLTSKLGELLHLRPGDSLTVEVLEGDYPEGELRSNRPTRSVIVAGLVDDLVGLSAYMERSALNRLMHEGATISGAYLAVDSSQIDPLYALLKRTPAIASVALRQTTIDRFQSTIADTRRVMDVIQVVFACIIAFGVVYNAARIALSERGRELATLRIIGFSRVQIAVVLLGEQAVLTIAAIPVGFLVGYGLVVMLSILYSTELYRLPPIVTQSTYAFALIVVTIAAIVSGLIVRRHLDHLDLIAVLKTRE